jgi:hypothetical protein
VPQREARKGGWGMKCSNAEKWLSERGIILEENFSSAFRGYAKKYKKSNGISTISEVYGLMNIKNQHLSYWKNKPGATQTKRFFKYNVIHTAGKLFSLNENETEVLANRAGLSLCADEKFADHFNSLLALYPGKKHELYDMAQVSERMFRYAKNGKHLTKETLLALAVAMGLGLDEIQVLLKKAGYILSKSLPNDMVLVQMIESAKHGSKKSNLVSHINDVLYELELPLLMTRDKF